LSEKERSSGLQEKKELWVRDKKTGKDAHGIERREGKRGQNGKAMKVTAPRF